MCISAITASLLAAGAGVAGTIYSADQSRKAMHSQMDMARDADTKAAQTANARLAQRRRALSSNSLIADSSTSGMASAGRATLGGA